MVDLSIKNGDLEWIFPLKMVIFHMFTRPGNPPWARLAPAPAQRFSAAKPGSPSTPRCHWTGSVHAPSLEQSGC